MKVLEIIKEYLEKHGYDGLYRDNECACHKDDLMPCDGMWGDCKPGYMRHDETGEYDFLIGIANND